MRTRQHLNSGHAMLQQRLNAENTSTLSEVAARGWASRLAGLVVAFLVIESLTGWWHYLAPFSVASQVQLALHVVVGLLLIVPGIYYLAGHILVWYAQKPTVVMVTGYALAIAVLACVTSGVLLTWQAANGPKLSPAWD